MRTVIIAQARMNSTRLWGKVLYPLEGRPLLAHVIDRLQAVRRAALVVVATSDRSADDVVVEWARLAGAAVFRGSETDVLGRFLAAARHYQAEAVVRVCCDAPLLDPVVIDGAIELFERNQPEVEYVSNMMHRTFPVGQSVEVMSADVLTALDTRASQPHQREHVTPYLIENRSEFRVLDYLHSPDLSHYNWTVDTIRDLEFVRGVYARLYSPGRLFGMAEMLRLLAAEPDLASKGVREC